MKRKFTLIAFIAFYLFNNVAQAQTVYASIASGAWNSGTVWETYPNYVAAIAASPGGGTASTSTTNPGGTHNVLIRNGHTITMGGANRGCKSIIIQAGGKLWANEATARRLQIGAGGTGFTYPLTDTVQIDGVIGGSTDGIFFETGANAHTVNITGSGTIEIARIRTVGGAGSAAGGVLNTNINTNITLTQSANYALSTIYTPTSTDNYTMTIAASKTVTISSPTGYFNTNSGSSFGNYTYNILGTLDFSLNTGTSGITQLQPLGAGSSVTLNVDGLIKAGSFTTSTNSGAAGSLTLNINNGGTIEAINPASTYTFAPTITFYTSGTGKLVRVIGASDASLPVSAPGSFETLTINNSGTVDNFSASVKTTFDFAPPADKRVDRQWTITEGVPGGTNATIKLGWLTSAQTPGFNPTSAVFIYRYNGTTWEATPAAVTGSGVASDPYIATASGFTAFSPFTVGNSPILPVSFISNKAFTKSNGIQVEWTTAEESGLTNFVIEKSADGRSFTQVATVAINRNNTYSWFDASPASGVNYYRIKSGEVAGSSKYTSIMKVTIGKKGAEMVIASNPIKGNILNLQLSGMEKGSYALTVYNSAGQRLLQKTIILEGSSLSQGIVLREAGKGLHTVILQGASATLSQKIIIE